MKKWTPSEIKELFPIILNITQDIIDNSIRADRNNCIACTALKTILPPELHLEIDWGTGIGRIKGVPIRSKMEILNENGKMEWQNAYLQHANTTAPITIKFIVDNR
jgi:hypothetical protein